MTSQLIIESTVLQRSLKPRITLTLCGFKHCPFNTYMYYVVGLFSCNFSDKCFMNFRHLQSRVYVKSQVFCGSTKFIIFTIGLIEAFIYMTSKDFPLIASRFSVKVQTVVHIKASCLSFKRNTHAHRPGRTPDKWLCPVSFCFWTDSIPLSEGLDRESVRSVRPEADSWTLCKQSAGANKTVSSVAHAAVKIKIVLFNILENN